MTESRLYFSDDTLTVYCGDALECLRELPDESVHCCVTSPPYWGLRDYQTAKWEGGDPNCDHRPPIKQGATGQRANRSNITEQNGAFRDVCGKCGARRIDKQLGLEPTPQEYVAKMVEVFAEVRRVLRGDGTLWLNLASSYFGSSMTGGNNGINASGGPDGFKQKRQFRVSRDKHPIQSPSTSHVPSCGIGDKERSDSQDLDSGCYDLCDGCRGALLNHSGHIDQQTHKSSFGSYSKACVDAPSDLPQELQSASPHDVQGSTTPRSSQQPQEGCHHCANCGACLSVLRSLTRDARLCVRKERYNSDISQNELGNRNRGKDASVMAYPYLSTECLNFKPKDLVPIPWLVAMALQQGGWYLRSDIIWKKPNPMPESVTDRPTKAHEYLFLMSKAERYHYDAEAIAEPSVKVGQVLHSYQSGAKDRTDVSETNDRRTRIGLANWNKPVPESRNKRSVWTVPTAPYSDCHFATFPPDLIKPCILAGCPVGGVVLDPFLGSGTTAMVANELGRKAIGIELNPKYIAMGLLRANQKGLAL